MLLELESTGNRSTCWTDGYRLAQMGQETALVYLSMFGPHNAVRSRWAKLCERGRSYVSTSQHSFMSITNDKYLSHIAPLKDKMIHMVLVHPTATNQCSVWSPVFFQIGDNASEKFFPRLNRMCSVPFRAEWAPFLWQEGQSSGLIESLDGIGMPGYKISAKAEDWSKLVTSAIKEKKLS